jgi:PKD repeat protein
LEVTAYPGASYEWKKDGVIQGNTSTLQTTGQGQYTVTITYGSGCIALDTFNLNIIQNLNINLGNDTTICIYDLPPILDAGLTNHDYFWTRNGVPFGTTQQIQTNLPGIYSVLVTSPTGCTGYDEIKIDYSNLEVDLGADRTLCPVNGANIILDCGIPNAQYQWFINGSPAGTNQTITSSISGIYKIVVTNSFGCIATDSVNITVASVINADFNAPSIVTVGQSVNFTDASTGTITSWIWNFGDNNYSTQQNPVYTFTQPGEIPVFLVVSNGLCTDTIVKIIQVQLDCANLGLNADFDLNPDTLDLNSNSLAEFTNTSTNGLTSQWIFHDGQVLNDWNVSKAYLSEGVYTIKLIVRNYNCVDSIEKQIVVIKPSLISKDKIFNTLNVLAYPNPTQGLIYLNFDQTLQNFQTELFDLNGKSYSFSTEQINSTTFKLDLSKLSSGVYVLKLHASDSQTIIRIIKL